MVLSEGLGIAFIIIISLLIILLVIASVGFWIWMIVDCAKRKFKDDTMKIIWLLVMVLIGIIGAIVYFFVVKVNKNG